LFGGYVFSAFPIERAHSYFDTGAEGPYEPDFWRYLHRRHGGFSRSKTLTYIRVSPDRDLEQLCAAIKAEFDSLANHGHLALHLPGESASAWRSSAYLTLYAEKFKEEKLSGAFFQPEEIAQQTRACVPLDPQSDYRFDLANVGFHYKDTFVLANGHVTDLLLVFQKNEPDETLIVCPACRSHDVQGNSYSSLGVKSWECRNPLCPQRSKFNRGKRYSFYQLLKHQAIEVRENQIPAASVRSWARDVQPSEQADEIVPMLMRHYSLAGDGVLLVNSPPVEPRTRKVTETSEAAYFSTIESAGELGDFLGSAYFARFCVEREPTPVPAKRQDTRDKILALHGNSTELMQGLEPCSIDGAVTSPPYYNAREYSQWDNIYCYLYDMFNSARMVLRLLKPGGYYLFNIFDYFDNERNITFSAMGQKRMILSAYTVQLFERAGFQCVGNVVWDKGDIEGKRAFNGGNFSPYYQAPFNCWEHILIFRKPGDAVQLLSPLPEVLRLKPVFKMVRGENRHGHTAPFPEHLPRLLLDRLPASATILDPFAGSMTTGVAATKTGHSAICIELDERYFELGRSMLEAATAQRVLV
jgi:DNA modification methylase